MRQKLQHLLTSLVLGVILLPGLGLAQQGTGARRTPPAEKPVPRRTAPEKPRPTTSADVEKDVAEALSLIEEKYVGGKNLKYGDVFQSSITGMLQTLDPHSRYMNREDFDEFKSDQRPEYYGIGASIINQTVAGKVDTYITATFEGSPAAKAGLHFGDRIVEVDAIDMRGKPSLDVRDKIRGPKGSKVRITVERAADNAPQTVEIVRDAVPQPSIPDSYMLDKANGVGYIGMTQGFNYSTAAELQESVRALKEQGMTSVVIDLRNNPGGFMDQAIRSAQIFLPKGQLILTQKGRNGFEDRNYRSDNTRPEAMTMVVLVNGNTALGASNNDGFDNRGLFQDVVAMDDFIFSDQSFEAAVSPVTAYSTPATLPTVAGRISLRSVSSALFDVSSVPPPTRGIATRSTLPFGDVSV